MDVGIREDQKAQGARRNPRWRQAWPAALGVVVAAGTAYGLTDGRDAAPVVAASGLVYLAAAGTGRPRAAWITFGIAFILITLDKFAGLDAVPWLLALAVVSLGIGLVRRRARPWWALPLQTAAMLLLGGVSLLALRADATAGALLVAAALFAHAAWDIYHHHVGRVVDRSMAQFCAVLDILVAAFVAILALRS